MARTQIYTNKDGVSMTKIWDSSRKYVGEVKTNKKWIRAPRKSLIWKPGDDDKVVRLGAFK